ncbi:YecA family protein [Paenibacillus tepidiphilus]|uniref:YecA family protein n=1 Tax=Paenibacillus tepidiphilus TaxID=2608683 RepID=UPI00123C1221|nr:SEC-C domain-containing protein [Paenibacillus tepidiphilus]
MAGRNDPCPCGSGKKYKQCCMLKQSETQTLEAKSRRFFERKQKLTYDLYTFVAQKQGGEWAFDHQKYKPFDSSLGYYRNGAGDMQAYFYQVYDNGLRGIEWFLEERGQRYSGEDREMLERWRDMKLSCYKLVDQYEQGLIIEDIWSEARYRMPYCETMPKLPPWTVSIGMLEPYIEDWCIHGVFSWGHPDVEAAVRTRVGQLQEETIQASGQKLAPADILAANYPAMLNLCSQINNGQNKPAGTLKDMREHTYVTREYTCEHPKLLADMLLERKDEYILSPGTDPAEDNIIISRAEKLDGVWAAIPADRRERLGLDEVHVLESLATIEMDRQGVTVHGWQGAELEAVLELLESELSAAGGLTLVDEQREAHQFPQDYTVKSYNIITELDLSEQEITDYGNLPLLLQGIQVEQEKHPELSVEMLVRRREFKQYVHNPQFPNLNLLRIALGLPESPFTG